MRPIELPHPEEMRPGAVFRDKGSVLQIEQGKHGDGDLRVLLNGRPISHQMLALLVLALYVAEERYRRQGKKGGEYLVTHMSSWIYWARKHLNKDAPLPGPGRPLG